MPGQRKTGEQSSLRRPYFACVCCTQYGRHLRQYARGTTVYVQTTEAFGSSGAACLTTVPTDRGHVHACEQPAQFAHALWHIVMSGYMNPDCDLHFVRLRRLLNRATPCVRPAQQPHTKGFKGSQHESSSAGRLSNTAHRRHTTSAS